MREFKGTPGPWDVSYRKDGWGVRVTNGTHSVVTFNGKRKKTNIDGICDLVAPKHADKKVADAHLIAAAPELLDALLHARDTVNSVIDDGYMAYIPLRTKIDSAIAKALGEDHD